MNTRLVRHIEKCILILAGGGAITFGILAQEPQDLPLVNVDDITYTGAFRLTAKSFGESNLNFSEGPIAYNPANQSLFIVGHTYQQAIAEFPVPQPVIADSLPALNMVSQPVQGFAPVLSKAPDGNPQKLNRIGGLLVYDNQLIINAYEYYDAPADNTLSTLIARDITDLAGSSVDGCYRFDAPAGHVSGWLSPIPPVWQAILGGTHITGQSSGMPIISRCSVGPSAFVFTPEELLDAASTENPVSVNTLLDFSLKNPLHEDLSNSSGENDIWTHLSRAVFGALVPGTRSYITIGHSGGHGSGVCYKCTQDDGHLCGGYCAPEADDYSLYYWFWDMRDLLEVMAGTRESWDVTPYEYGEFPNPFPLLSTRLGGGTYDPETGRLFLTLQGADREQGRYANPPLVLVYQVGGESGVRNDRGVTDGTTAALSLRYAGQNSVMVFSTEAFRGPVHAELFSAAGRRICKTTIRKAGNSRLHIKLPARYAPAGSVTLLKLSGPGWSFVRRLYR